MPAIHHSAICVRDIVERVDAAAAADLDHLTGGDEP